MTCATCKTEPCRCKRPYDKKSIGLLILRVTLGAIFVYHGYGKLFGGNPSMEMFTGMVQSMGFPLPGLFAWIAALTEFFGGLAMILGIGTKFASPLISVVMLVAIFLAKKGKYPLVEVDVALLAIAVSIYFIGPGKYSLASKLGMGNCDASMNGCCGKDMSSKEMHGCCGGHEHGEMKK